MHLKSLLLTVVILTLLSLPLAAQSEPDSTIKNSVYLNLAQDIVHKLQANDLTVKESILWELLCINDDDLGLDYDECLEDGTVEFFMEDMIAYLNECLHYDGDSSDPFTDWVDDFIDDDYYIMCSNKVYNVEMLFKVEDTDKILLREITIYGD